MQLYPTENNLPSYGTELASSDIAFFNWWSVHKCDICVSWYMAFNRQKIYTCFFVKIYAYSFSLAFWIGFGSEWKALDGGAGMQVRCINYHWRLWWQRAQFICPDLALLCHPSGARICPSGLQPKPDLLLLYVIRDMTRVSQVSPHSGGI